MRGLVDLSSFLFSLMCTACFCMPEYNFLDSSHIQKTSRLVPKPNRNEEVLSKSSNSSHIVPDCKAFLDDFSHSSSKFIECVIKNARPFRFCEGCAEHYKRALTIYNDIVKVVLIAYFEFMYWEFVNHFQDYLLLATRADSHGAWATVSKCFMQ